MPIPELSLLFTVATEGKSCNPRERALATRCSCGGEGSA